MSILCCSGTRGLSGSGDLWFLPTTARAAMPSSEELDPDPLLLLIEELDIFDPGKGANGGIQSLDLPTLASSSEAGADPNGGIQFLCLGEFLCL